MRPGYRQAGAALVALLAVGCATGDRPELADIAVAPTTAPNAQAERPPEPTGAGSPLPTSAAPPQTEAAPNGRVYPSVPAGDDAAIARLIEVERLLRRADPDGPDWPDLAHEQQVLYRAIGRSTSLVPALIATAPPDLRPFVERQIAARRAIARIGVAGAAPPVNVPAWAIRPPLPADDLRALYDAAAATTGIGWEFLAAINFIETGFGRIHGLSTAGARGPMQFLPTTWEEVSDGDIDDPRDAIPAAARYLVRRGAPDDMHRALWGYNNSDAYVAAVTHYANLFRDDERSFLAAHAWEIHYSSADGDLWFPVGYEEPEPRPVAEYLADAPWSAPPERSP